MTHQEHCQGQGPSVSEERIEVPHRRVLMVKAGPSKFDLMLSLFEGKEVTFTFEVIGKQRVIVDKVWCFGVDQGNNTRYWVWFANRTRPNLHWVLSGAQVHFDTNDRLGHCQMKPTEENAAQFDMEIAPELKK